MGAIKVRYALKGYDKGCDFTMPDTDDESTNALSGIQNSRI